MLRKRLTTPPPILLTTPPHQLLRRTTLKLNTTLKAGKVVLFNHCRVPQFNDYFVATAWRLLTARLHTLRATIRTPLLLTLLQLTKQRRMLLRLTTAPSPTSHLILPIQENSKIDDDMIRSIYQNLNVLFGLWLRAMVSRLLCCVRNILVMVNIMNIAREIPLNLSFSVYLIALYEQLLYQTISISHKFNYLSNEFINF
jgi:hypothetical protein